MKIKLSKHAVDQIQSRRITSCKEVLEAVRYHASTIEDCQVYTDEVKVIVKLLDSYRETGGSKGSVVIACVNTYNGTVKTVMLSTRGQVIAKHKNGTELYLE